VPSINCVVRSKVSNSPRVKQLSAMFDVPLKNEEVIEWTGDLPIELEDWNVGLIVGPSGCGKTTVTKSLWEIERRHTWKSNSMIDDFPEDLSIKEISRVCSSVGFNTIPAWMRSFKVLSNGEQFRANIARSLLSDKDIIVIDEFTSVVDRQVAKITSHAVQKNIRKMNRKFIGISCHYDIIDWLQPDWIFEPAKMKFTRRSVQRRPKLSGRIQRVKYDAWKLFSKYHYLTANLHKAARCYGLFVENELASFAGILNRPHSKAKNIYGCSRLVTLPDYQGLGLAFILIDGVASLYKGVNRRMRTYPAHPGLIAAFAKSNKWIMKKKPGVYLRRKIQTSMKGGKVGGRPNATFEYVGESYNDKELALRIINAV